MRYTFLRDILSQPYMLEPSLVPIHIQMFRGLLMGASMMEENEIIQSSIDVSEHDTKQSINVINLKGFMSRNDGECSYGTRTLAKHLKEADAEDATIGHIIVIDSGGGAANSVPDLADAIQSLTKPCVAFVDGMMASAAIYAGSYCDYIIANRKDDRIGCVGTMLQIIDYPKQANLASGEICVRVYADGSEEKNLDYEEALSGNIQLVKDEVLNPLNQEFVQAMLTNRHLDDTTLLKGKTYFAKDVVGTLIDEIGDMQTAINKVISLSEPNVQIKNHISMFKNINLIPSCAVLEEDQDKMVTLTEEQMTDIDAELDKLNKLILSQNEQLSQLNKSITDLTNSLKVKEDRITELENAIEGTSTQTEVEEKFDNGNPDKKSVETTEENSLDYCINFLKNRK